MKTILILLDSLNRHMLPMYGGQMLQTPNLRRLAERGVVFDNHWCGSMPCMPARREIFTGRMNLLECPWNAWELFDRSHTQMMRERGVHTHMITDHYHYFERPGPNYQTLFDTWEFIRGQEGDWWKPMVDDPPEMPPGPPKDRNRLRRQDWVNRHFMDVQDDAQYPTPQCFQKAIEFLEINGRSDNWHLHLECFDPHEPFSCPDRFVEMYESEPWTRERFDWPAYGPVDDEDEAAIRHVRASYAGTLTMADVWLGKLLDKMDELDLWKDTTVLLTTDHGHMLSEHGYWAKNYMHVYQELSHIPMIVCSPNADAGRRVSGLTTTVDLTPTLLDLWAMEPTDVMRGRSARPMLSTEAAGHDAVLFGYFGKDVNVTDGRYTYCRQPIEDSPVYAYTTMPCFAFRHPDSMKEATLATLPHADGMQLYRIEHRSRRHRDAPDFHPLFDIHTDPGQENPLRDADLESRMVETLVAQLRYHDAPACQYSRLGLDVPDDAPDRA